MPGELQVVSPVGTCRTVERVVLTDAARFPFSPDDLRRLEAAGIALVEVAGHDPEQVVDAVSSADAVFVYSARLDRDLLARFGSCHLVVRCGSGYDLIDVVAARDLGIDVAYVPAYGTVDVGEHALALTLAVMRRLVDLDRAVRQGGWPSYAQAGTMHRLAGRRLGLLGFGRIAQHLAAMARALEMTVQAHDPFVEPAVFEQSGVRSVGLSELAVSSDVISLHLPLSVETAGVVDEAFLAKVKAGAILINTSRGELVDEVALVRALREGRLAGAGLDVLVEEPPRADHPLLGLPGTVLSPHSAAFTDEALASVRSQAIDELLCVIDGRSLQHPASPTTPEEAVGHAS